MEEVQGKTPGILVVEDDPVVGRLTITALNMLSSDVTLATSADEALVQCSSRIFDVVVSDMKMPGMNGLELLQIMATNWPLMRRILASGEGETIVTNASVDVIDRYLPKPWQITQLIDVVTEELGFHEDPALRATRSKG